MMRAFDGEGGFGQHQSLVLLYVCVPFSFDFKSGLTSVFQCWGKSGEWNTLFGTLISDGEFG